MQEVKNNVKKIGEKMRGSNDAHKALLRQKLIALHPEEPVVFLKRFAWFPVFSWGAVAILVLVIGNVMFNRPILTPEYQQSITEYDQESLREDLPSDPTGLVGNAGLLGDVEMGDVSVRDIYMLESGTKKDHDIVNYEEDNGTMLEQSVNISMLTQKDDASETIAALFASLGGHLASIRSNDDRYTAITGSIPASRMSFFYEQLDTFVKNDAFIEKAVRGDSVTIEAIDLAEREEALRAAETSVTEQLQAATTEEEKKKLQESLETISEEMVQLTEERDALSDRVDFVTVSVNIEKLPSLWGVQNEHQLNDVIAGYESPTLWQEMVINVLTVFFVAVKFLSITFWILIPFGIFVLTHIRRRRMLRELD